MRGDQSMSKMAVPQSITDHEVVNWATWAFSAAAFWFLKRTNLTFPLLLYFGTIFLFQK